MAAVPSAGRAAQVERPAAETAAAARSLYERFAGQIYGYCLHQLGSREEAEDAVQSTFLNAFRGLKRGVVPEIESAWLFKIAHNVCLSRRRSSSRRGRVEAPNNMEVLQEVVPARERGNDDLIRLQDALELMPDTQRRAILLREWQGLSYREIGEALDLSQSAVETLIFRARRTLAAGLEEPPKVRPSWRKRTRFGIDAGGLATAFKTLLGGGAAVKTAATIAAVATTAVAVSKETQHHALRPPKGAHSTPARVAPPVTGSYAETRVFAAMRPHAVASKPRRATPHAAADRVQRHALSRVTIRRRPGRAVAAQVAPQQGAPAHPAHPTHPASPPAKVLSPPTASPAAPAAPDATRGKGHAKKHAPVAAPKHVAPPVTPAEPGGAASPSGPPSKPDKPDSSSGNGHK